MYFTGATSAGSPDVLNEDWMATTSDLVVMLDGATIRTETGCRHGAAWYTRRLGAAIIANAAVRSTPLQQVLATAIREVAALHPECDLTHPGTPSAAVGIVRFDSECLRYLVLGDITVVLDTIDGVTVVSDQRISASATAERAVVDRYLIGTREKATALVAMKHAELAARNTKDGYWIAAANPTAAQHAITVEVPMSAVHWLAVLTDGAARYVDLFHCADWAAVLSVLSRTGPQWFIDKLVRPVESADPLGARYRRNKRSDDATVVFAELVPVVDERVWSDFKPQTQLDAEAELLARLDDPDNYGDGMLQRATAERGRDDARN
jgi:hypothetical protein